MKRWLIRGLVFAALAALGVWGWRVLFPGPEQVIRKRLARLAQAASFTAQQSPLAKLAYAQKLASFLTRDVVVAIDVAGREPMSFTGRDNLVEAAMGARSAIASLKVEFLDINVNVWPDRQSAVTHLTVRAKTVEKDPYVEELKITWSKLEGQWLIRRIETVKTLAEAEDAKPAGLRSGLAIIWRP